MKEKQILDSLKRSIDRAPIDILDRIKEEPRVKMLRHDDITRQETRRLPLKNMMSYALGCSGVPLCIASAGCSRSGYRTAAYTWM